VGVAIVGHQLGKGPCRLDDAICMLVEHLEKIALAGQQLSKQHADSWSDLFNGFVTQR
jgi:hypothetical protein